MSVINYKMKPEDLKKLIQQQRHDIKSIHELAKQMVVKDEYGFLEESDELFLETIREITDRIDTASHYLVQYIWAVEDGKIEERSY